MKTVAVFFGGRSNEREISVITGMLAVNLLRGADYHVLPVYLNERGGMYCAERAVGVEDFARERNFPEVVFTCGGVAYRKKPKKKIFFDCALNCCHGGAGENGTLAALFDWYRIKSASPAMTASAVFMDKSIAKIAAKGLGLPVAPSFFLDENGWEDSLGTALKGAEFPLVVKPCSLGSSIGIAVAGDEAELYRALKAAFRLDSRVLVEAYLKGKRDINCAAALRDGELVLSETEEVFSGGRILSFGEKYEGDAQKSKRPADITAEQKAEIRRILTTIYRAFSLFGVVRADFILSEDKVYFNELNTVPGSLSCYLFGQTLTEAKEHIVSLVEEAFLRRAEEKELIETGILRSEIFSGGKGCKRRG